MTTRDECLERDARDPLNHLREEFTLADSEIYLDGNSLGPVSRSAREHVLSTIDGEWAQGLAGSWTDAGWMTAPTRVGDRVAPLIGAASGEVLVCDTLTVALAKLIGGALELRPDRHVVLTDADNFRSDIYIVEAMAERAGRPIGVRTIKRDDLDAHLGNDVALVMLTHVDFCTGEMLDLRGVTARVHDAGALMLWDFAHSAGAVPLDVTGAGVDFAAGCGYKYLNGGPGAPAFLYVRRPWQAVMRNPLPGWMGHARPFDFELAFHPALGVQSFATSTPSIIALAALDGALDVFDSVTMSQVREKSLALTDLFIERVEERLRGYFEILTPKEHSRRGSQVSLRHAEGYAIIRALDQAGVVGDFRPPDVCRFGFTPLYLRHVDVYDAVERLASVMATGAFRDERYQ